MVARPPACSVRRVACPTPWSLSPEQASARRSVHFNILAEEIIFDPTEVDRVDLPNIAMWAMRTGTLPVTQRGPKAWSPRLDPAYSSAWLSNHFTQGCPSPPGHIKTCEAIASRNAANALGPEGATHLAGVLKDLKSLESLELRCENSYKFYVGLRVCDEGLTGDR